MKPRLILASGSPRRKELLDEAGWDFEVVLSPAEELHDVAVDYRTLCQENAALKARAVARNHPDAIVIGADTLVCLDGVPLGKPKDEDEARAMLRSLSGRINFVCTGVCLCGPGGREHVFYEVSEVEFRVLSETDIADYMALVHTLDKAGAYAAQEHGERIIVEVRGDLSNVVGLPVERLRSELESFHF
jgi:septum formation protein